MAQYVTAPEKAVFSIGDLPFEHGAFMEPLSCVLHGIERVSLSPGDRVLILGAGPIGILLQQCVQLRGAMEITVVERQAGRAELAEAYGADSIHLNIDELDEERYDLVIDATGNTALMSRTIDYARHGGTVLLFGVPAAGEMMKLEGFKIFRKGLTLLSSFTSLRNSYQAVNLLGTGKIDVSRLISHQLPLGEFERGVALISGGLEAVKKVLILPHR
jgi:2-desacetyl-2-hydroxyethyl bacteriochlorophyllide A dehydrogenase